MAMRRAPVSKHAYRPSPLPSPSSSTLLQFHHHLPPSLRPLVRAYLLGYAWTVGPRVLALLLRFVLHRAGSRRGPRDGKDAVPENGGSQSEEGSRPADLAASVWLVLRKGLEPRRFPAFCALLAGGSSLLEGPALRLCRLLFARRSPIFQSRLARWLATFVPALLSIRLLRSGNGPPSPPRDGVDTEPLDHRQQTSPTGRTLDLTLFFAVRASDIIAGEFWARFQKRRGGSTRAKSSSLIPTLVDPLIFASSCALVMWSFIYAPDKLPRSYAEWIGSVAAVDDRLLEALRRCRAGDIRYGRDTGQAGLLKPMCAAYGHPPAWGDPAVTVPYPCELIHMGGGPSCEYHALSRFCRVFVWAMATHVPLNLLGLLLRRRSAAGAPRRWWWRRRRRFWPPPLPLVLALRSAARSSAFLASFVALFWYGLCLARTRLGPSLLGTTVAARQHLDAGACVGAGCALCGWSVFLESVSRRRDVALFVAPRALATLLPVRHDAAAQRWEGVVFAASAAVVFACARENPGRVRGVLGSVLGKVLER